MLATLNVAHLEDNLRGCRVLYLTGDVNAREYDPGIPRSHLAIVDRIQKSAGR